MKKFLIALAVLLCSFTLLGCSKKIILHCDGCGKEIEFPADTSFTEDSIILCDDCKKLVGE